MEDLVEPTLLQVKEEEEEMVQIKEEEDEMVQIKEEEEELDIKQEGSDDEGSGSSRDLICDESAEEAGNPAALPANQASAGPAPPAGPNRSAAGTSAPLRTFRSVEKRKRARKLHRRLSLINGLISESLLLLGKTPGRHSARRRNAVRHLDSFDKTKATLLLHATRTLLHSVSCDLNVISRDLCDSTC
ncbi:uncharacterized protein LOC102228083 isoform X4 [Xiphophorus maculatus]|uniref:uncharacterized protein LOC102228083 isoform X4 n=1 Tax=Xiphophorus maculatus TaxID=8083 RepID=UPI000C6CF647|nr:uncharacterized protein LOC102228083 isoform X4 [Xiphophorus maculatus]